MNQKDYMRTLAERLKNDPHTIEELIPLAMAEIDREDSDEPMDALAVLQADGRPEVFEVAKWLCASDDPKERDLGASILSQNVVSEKNFPEEKFDILFGLLENDTSLDVLYSAIFALGHIRDPRAIQHILKFKNHADDEIRFSVVHGLWGHEDKSAIEALIELSGDPVAKIRDWATFGLGSQLNDEETGEPITTPEITNALAARLQDEDGDTLMEAIVGLGVRGDRRALEPLREEMEAGANFNSALEAAAALADPRLLSALLALREEGKVDELLEEAIEACGGKGESTT